MDKRKLNWVTMAFVVLTVLVVGVMLSHTLRRSNHIVLPDVLPPGSEQQGQQPEGSALSVVEITPDTVQAAVATLARPEHYRRTVTVDQLWQGGSGSVTTDVAVLDGWTRMDRVLPDGQSRHTITDGEITFLWYNGGKDLLELPAGEFSADLEQSIPTYEDVLSLPVEDIVTSDFRDLSGVPCIYVETAEDQEGYALRYWVSVDSGLLVSAEKLLDGETIYRMGALELDSSEPPIETFRLPNDRWLVS